MIELMDIPACAIARRVRRVLEDRGPFGGETDRDGLAPALFTSNKAPGSALAAFLLSRGLRWETSPALAALTQNEQTG